MVSLSKLLAEDRIIYLTHTEKTEAIRELVNTFCNSSGLEDYESLYTAIMEREALLPTGIGYGLAIPHAKVPYVKEFGLALGISGEGIKYGSPVDEIPAQILFLIVGPEGRQTDYLRLLARVNQFLKREREKILAAKGINEIYSLTLEY
jgi:PTS system nitrogen regulatory IIA component